MISNNILLDALKTCGATIVFVSHDRYFIQHCATKVLELHMGKGTLYYGDYDYYLWKREHHGDDIGGEEQKKKEKLIPADGRVMREEEKKKKSRLRKMKEEETDILCKLEKLGRNREAIEHSMAEEEVYRDGEKMKALKQRLSENTTRHDELFKKWEKVEEEIRLLETEG
jgi:ATP-binding cassette subfamily F protein 3